MAISGRIAQASRLGLEDVLARNLQEDQIAEQAQQRQFDNRLRLRKIASDEQQAAEAGTRYDQARSDRLNTQGLELMGRDRKVYEDDQDKAALDAALADPNTPPALKKIIGLRKIGISASPSADMLLSPDERDAEEQRGLRRVEEVADIQGRTAAKYRQPREAPAPERHAVVVNGKTVYKTEDEINAMGGVDPTPRQRPVSGAERQTVSFFNRGKEGHEIATQLEDEIGKMSLGGQMRLEHAPNWAQTSTNQSYRQAQREFTEARLRKESGAAIPPAEYANDAKTYFAQPGDTPQLIKQKQQARRTILNGLGNASGQAYEEFYGERFSPENEPGSGGGMKVRMIAPDGSTRDVDQSQVEHYKSLGAKVAGGR